MADTDETNRSQRRAQLLVGLAALVVVLFAVGVGVMSWSSGIASGPVAVPHARQNARIFAPSTTNVLAVSPDGKVIATGGGAWQGVGGGGEPVGVGTDIFLWDAKTDEPLRQLHGHTQPVVSLAFSPDSTQLVSSSNDKTMRIWNVADATEARSIILEGEPRDLPPSASKIIPREHEMFLHVAWPVQGPFAGKIVAGTAISLGVWDPATGDPVNVWQQKRATTTLADGSTRNGIQYHNTAMALSADGTRVATVDEETTLRVWEIGAWKPLQEMRGHTLNVKCVALSPDGRLAASGAADGTARVWDVETGMQISRYDMMPGNTGGSTVYAVAFSPDGALVACAGDGAGERDGSAFCVHLFDARTGAEAIMLGAQEKMIRGLAFETGATRDQNWLWSTGSGGQLMGWLIDTETNRSQGRALEARRTELDQAAVALRKKQGELQNLTGHAGAVRGLAMNEHGTLLASMADDGTARLWDVDAGKEIRRIESGDRRSSGIALSPDQHWLVVTGSGGNMLYDIAGADHGEGKAGRSLKISGPMTTGPSGPHMSFSADSRMFAMESPAISWGRNPASTGPAPSPVNLFRVEDAAPVVFSEAGFRSVSNAGPFSPDGERELRWAVDVQIWNVKSNELLRTLSGHTSGVHAAAWNSDGTQIVSGAQDGSVRIWNAASGEALKTLPAMGVVAGVAWLPGNRVVAAGLTELIVWDAGSGAELKRLTVTALYAYALCVSGDGKRAATAGADGVIRVWSME